MAQRYLLPCNKCDQRIAIETTQAGQTITCSGCRSQIKIGTLREIKALASADINSGGATVERKKASMSMTNRAIFVSSLVLVLIGAIWGVGCLTEVNELSALPINVATSDEKMKRLESIIAATPPAEMLDRWNEVKVEEVAEWVEDPSLKIKRDIQKYKVLTWSGFGVAGLGVVGIVLAFLLPNSRPARK